MSKLSPNTLKILSTIKNSVINMNMCHENESIFETNSTSFIANLFLKENCYDSPINLNVGEMIPINLPDLLWYHNFLTCKKMKLLNSGHTIILSARWHDETPYISGGPLNGDYIFSQLHFHWGSSDLEGSEHTVDETKHPIEMHVVHYKSGYLTHEAAIKQKDGIVTLVYFFKLQSHINPEVQILLDSAKEVKKASTNIRIGNHCLNLLVKPFHRDYFMYWGSVATPNAIILNQYLICRVPIGISSKQVNIFRKLYNIYDEPNLQNFREVVKTPRNVYHVTPSAQLYSTLQPIPVESYITWKRRD